MLFCRGLILGLGLGFVLGRLLQGRKEHDHRAALHGGSLIDATLFCTGLLKFLEKLGTDLGVTELTSSEFDHDLNLISVSEEAEGVVDLGIEVVYINVTGELDLLDLHDMLLFTGFLFLLVALKAELSVVHDTAHGRIALGSDQNEIESLVVGHLESRDERDHTDLLTVRTDDTNLLGTAKARKGEDSVVDHIVFCIVFRSDCKTPPKVR